MTANFNSSVGLCFGEFVLILVVFFCEQNKVASSVGQLSICQLLVHQLILECSMKAQCPALFCKSPSSNFNGRPERGSSSRLMSPESKCLYHFEIAMYAIVPSPWQQKSLPQLFRLKIFAFNSNKSKLAAQFYQLLSGIQRWRSQKQYKWGK